MNNTSASMQAVSRATSAGSNCTAGKNKCIHITVGCRHATLLAEKPIITAQGKSNGTARKEANEGNEPKIGAHLINICRRANPYEGSEINAIKFIESLGAQFKAAGAPQGRHGITEIFLQWDGNAYAGEITLNREQQAIFSCGRDNMSYFSPATGSGISQQAFDPSLLAREFELLASKIKPVIFSKLRGKHTNAKPRKVQPLFLPKLPNDGKLVATYCATVNECAGAAAGMQKLPISYERNGQEHETAILIQKNISKNPVAPEALGKSDAAKEYLSFLNITNPMQGSDENAKLIAESLARKFHKAGVPDGRVKIYAQWVPGNEAKTGNTYAMKITVDGYRLAAMVRGMAGTMLFRYMPGDKCETYGPAEIAHELARTAEMIKAGTEKSEA